MSYILLIIPILLFIAIYSRKLKEPMIGYCYSEKTPYHTKEVHLESRPLRKKIRTIRKALEDKASWEHTKINSYIPKYSTTQNNDLKTNPQEFELSLGNVTKHAINPIVTQFKYDSYSGTRPLNMSIPTIDSFDKTPSFYMAPKYQYNSVKRFNKEADWPIPPYNSKSSLNHLDVTNFQEY